MTERTKLEMPANLDSLYCRAEEAQATANQTIADLRKSTAETLMAQAGISVGDKIDVNGWSHRGKQIIVERPVFDRLYGGDYILRILGGVLKKDGTMGQHQGEHIIEFTTRSTK